jgi:CubicO group peptidase (beta-lactamase class C family)
MSLDDLLAQIGEDCDKHLADLDEATVLVGLSLQGRRHLLAHRSPGASRAELPEAHSVYEIGSISKTFTTTLLAVLEQRGLLSVEDPIGKHLPPAVQLRPEIAGITLRQLMTHSAGFPSVGKLHEQLIAEEARGAAAPPFGAYTHYLRYRKEHLYDDLETVELAYPTGEGWLYSVLGMGTLGHVVELAAGRPYEELLREVVCEPLGLRDTGYTLSADQQERIVKAYFSDGSPCPNWYHDVMLPQGGLRSTMTDLLTFGEANLRAAARDDELSRAVQRARAVHFTLPKGTPTTQEMSPPWQQQVVQGLAWRGFEKRPRASWHPGTTLFYHSGLAVDDDAQVVCALLSSSHDTLGLMEPFAGLAGREPLAAASLRWFERACSMQPGRQPGR